MNSTKIKKVIFKKPFSSGRSAFSLPETMLSLVLVGFLSAAVFYVISASNRSSANSFHLYTAEQIAKEPLEVFLSLGYHGIINCESEAVGDYRLNQWQVLEAKSQTTAIVRPEAVALFERFISLQRLTDAQVNAVLVNVRVRPVGSAKNSILSAKNEVVCSDIIIEQK